MHSPRGATAAGALTQPLCPKTIAHSSPLLFEVLNEDHRTQYPTRTLSHYVRVGVAGVRPPRVAIRVRFGGLRARLLAIRSVCDANRVQGRGQRHALVDDAAAVRI
jgi:hypothetical protein